MKKKAAKLNGGKLSAILRSLPKVFSGPTITIDELNKALAGRAYGLLLLILALPNLIPLPTPGLSATVGAPLMLVSLQHIWGKKTPWLPKFFSRKRIKRADLEKMIKRVMPVVKRLEKLLRPRMQMFVRPPADRIIAAICFILSLMIMLPVPFGNAIPALAICFFALGMMQKDGMCTLVALIITSLGGIAFFVFFDTVADAMSDFFG